MTARGVGSRSSPIIIDDDEDNVPPPPTAKVNLNPSTSLTGTTLQEPIYVESIETHSPIPARRKSPSQLENGIGYSILVRMGFKPGHGLGVNLEGVTSPIQARLRPQRFPAGLGASHVVSSSKATPRNTQNVAPTTNSKRSRSAVYRRIQDSSSSSPADATTTTLSRRSPEHSSNQDDCPDLVPEKTSHDSPSGPSCPLAVNPKSANGPQPTYVGGTHNVNIVKTPSSLTMQHRPGSSPHNIPPHESGRTRPLDSATTSLSANLYPPFPSLPPRPPHLPLPPVSSRANAPINPLLIDMYSNNPTLPIPPPTFAIPYVTRLRGKAAFIGDDTKPGGMRGLFLREIEPPANPSCSVVMEILPRKFRTESFILGWLSQFPFRPSRYELVEGKVFFEFADEGHARLAWYSPRMGDLDGLLSVRLFWYRVLPPQPASENTDTPQRINAKGTIEDPARPQLQSVSDSSTDRSDSEGLLELKADRSLHTPTHKSAPPTLPFSSSTINIENPRVTVNPQPKDIKSNPDNQTAQGTSLPKHSFRTPIPAPTVMTGPFLPPTPTQPNTQPNDSPDCQMVADSVMTGALPPGGVSSFFPDIMVSQASISAPLPPVSSSTFASTSSAVFPTFPPGILDSSATSTPIDQQAHPISVNQELMETSSLAAEISRLETEAEPTEFGRIYETFPQTDSLMDIADSETLAKEQILREMVLQSRKRKFLQAPSDNQPTSTTAPTATSENALEQLAVNFIADAIARPPPPKRVKITPSPSAMAAWRTRLEQHIKSSKRLMAKIQSAQSKTERTKLMMILREKDRLLENEKMALFSCPVGDVAVPVSPWPDSHPDQGILELSDTENEGYASDDDDDME